MKISEESLTIRLSTELKIAVERRAAHYGVNLSEIGRLAACALGAEIAAKEIAMRNYNRVPTKRRPTV